MTAVSDDRPRCGPAPPWLTLRCRVDPNRATLRGFQGAPGARGRIPNGPEPRRIPGEAVVMAVPAGPRGAADLASSRTKRCRRKNQRNSRAAGILDKPDGLRLHGLACTRERAIHGPDRVCLFADAATAGTARRPETTKEAETHGNPGEIRNHRGRTNTGPGLDRAAKPAVAATSVCHRGPARYGSVVAGRSRQGWRPGTAGRASECNRASAFGATSAVWLACSR
jgi:hypothetical protein